MSFNLTCFEFFNVCPMPVINFPSSDARAVGLMTMIDHGAPDHKVIAVMTGDPIYNEFQKASDFPKHIFKMLRQFFEDYKMLEGKDVEVDEILPAEAAYAVIEDCLARYAKARRTGLMKGLR